MGCKNCPGGIMDKKKLGGAPFISAVIVLAAVVFLGGVHLAFNGSVNF